MIKKQLIMETALNLFIEQGFEATSVQQITEACGISKGAFYLSFKSKDALILELIEQRLHEQAAKIEQLVSSIHETSELLYAYFHLSLTSIKTHTCFANVFLTEQRLNINSDLLKTLEYYNHILNHFVFQLVKKQFPHFSDRKLTDLTYIIQMFVKGYGELFFKKDLQLQLDTVCRAAVEKVLLIAQHSETTCIPDKWLYNTLKTSSKLTKEELISLLQIQLQEQTDPIVQQSLQLLCDHLHTAELSPVIEKGLVNNIKNNTQSSWIAYIYDISTTPTM